MRKWILPGLLALSFGILANTALAGNVADCDDLTDPESDLFAPKLYGLCVAWHNANENAKPALADRFASQAKKLYGLVDFDVPGSADYTCPCWSGVSEAYISLLGPPSTLAPLGDAAYVEWNYTDDTLGDVEESYFADKNSGFELCWRDVNGEYGGEYKFIPLAGESDTAKDCFDELIEIACMNVEGDCPP